MLLGIKFGETYKFLIVRGVLPEGSLLVLPKNVKPQLGKGSIEKIDFFRKKS